MKFERVSKWAEQSECHRYTVAAVRVNGVYHFEAWRLTSNSHPGIPLGSDRSASRARDLCATDLTARIHKPPLGEAA